MMLSAGFVISNRQGCLSFLRNSYFPQDAVFTEFIIFFTIGCVCVCVCVYTSLEDLLFKMGMPPFIKVSQSYSKCWNLETGFLVYQGPQVLRAFNAVTIYAFFGCNI